MKQLGVGLLLVVASLGAACYSKTVEKEVVTVPVPKTCERVVWVAPAPPSQGYWRCA